MYGDVKADLRPKRSITRNRLVQKSKDALALISFPNLSLAFVLLCCAAIGALEQYEVIFSVAILGVLLLNWNKDEFYVYIAVFIFYWEQFYLRTDSTPLYRMYCYLFILRFIKDIYTIRFRPHHIAVIAVFVAYCILGTGKLDMHISIMNLSDAVVAFAATSVFRQKPELMRKFVVVFVLTAICAGIYSLLSNSIVSYETGLGAQVYTRYYGTVGDANYAGCFYNVALFMTMCSDSFRKWYIRWPVVGILVYFILLTASQTALLCMLIGICVYIVVRFRMVGVPFAAIIAVGAILGVLALINIPALRESGPFATLANRLSESLVEFERGNMDNLTTNRTELWQSGWNHFINQSWLKRLIGGNAISLLIIEERFVDSFGGAVHQSYIQGLLSFGIIGWIIVFGTYFWQTIVNVTNCLRLKVKEIPIDLLRCTVMTAYVFVLYAFTIDMFMDWRALFLFFF